ncbi:MAG: Crp/Fnr family transcriptional regulator [Peptococcaceae bacterium BICA1-7]|nr:MAG: Crp/Fnr family transcriptional regulator [Peptococcaceae bacterium BICA1-7]
MMDIERKIFVLDDNEKALVRQSGQTIRYPKGQLIFSAREYSSHVYLVESGWVKIFRLASDGRKLTVAIRHPGELVGIAETLCNSVRTCYGEAMDEVGLVVLKRDSFIDLLMANSQLSFRVAEALGGRLREAQAIIHEMVYWPVQGRLAQLLLKLAERAGVDIGEGVELNLRLTHEEIASMIGTSRPTVTSAFNAMKSEKAIVMEGRDIKIIFPKKLKKWLQQ